MTNRISKIFRQKEAGFTLVEVLIAVVIAGMVATGASIMIFDLFNVNSTNANTVTVTTNIESATHYLIRDVQMTPIDVNTNPDTGIDEITGIGETETEWLWLEWTWTDGKHRVAYEFEGDKLYRTHSIIDSNLPETRTLIAEYIDAGLTDWQLLIGESGEITVEITISATTGGYKPASETRTIQVAPRVTT